MQMENIIEELRYFNKKFPRETIEKAVELKEDIIPVLLEELDKVIENPKLATEDVDYMMHMYAMFLLAQFREEKAFIRIIDLMYFSAEETDRIFGDVLTEDLGSILYSTFDGDFNSLKSVIENPLLNIYGRGAALDMYGKLYADGLVAKEEVINYLRELLSENSRYDEADIATFVQMLISTRKIFEMKDDVQTLYDDYRIEEGMVGSYDEFVDFMYLYQYNREPVYYIEDTIQEMSGWASFEQTKAQKLEQEKRLKELEKEYGKEERAERLAAQTATKKVGRNDPCSCGSGKKYKKCCIKKDQAAKNSFLETAEEQKQWLKYYPKTDGERQENERKITDDFDDEAIEIDRLVYLALHHRPIPMWIKRDYQKENRIIIAYLIQALEKFNKKRLTENIASFAEYDSHHKIHYRSLEWVGRLRLLIEEHELESQYKEAYENVKQTLNEITT